MSDVNQGESQQASPAIGHPGFVIRAGDIVHHEPTGEEWVVAYIDGEYLAWCGWPAGEAKLNDCWLKKSCTDEEHLHWLQQIAKSDGKRARMAHRALEAIAKLHCGPLSQATDIAKAAISEGIAGT